jgi:TonB family protein
MLMEYLEGKPLKTLLDEEFGRGMPLMRAWPMIYDIGSALAYAHDHNVVHSDIKPSNVIITSSGSCKLLDFGIARADRNRTTTRDATVIGALTPAYASCEMFEGRAPDQSDDVYALGCVIYEMLTGKHPFGRINAIDARARKLQPAPIKVLTGRQNQALARALEFDRKRRTASVEILLEGLKGMANNERDRRAWISTAAAIAAIGAVSTGWFLEHRAAHSRDAVVDAVPSAPQAPAATSAPAPTPAVPESRVPAPTVSKVEHGKDVARPDLAATATPPPSKGKTAAAVVAASVADTGPAMIKPTAAPAIPSPAPAKAAAATANAATANAAPAIATPVGTNGAPLLAQSKPPPAPTAQPPAIGSATSPANNTSKTIPASVAAASLASGSAAPPVQSKTTSALAAAEPAVTGSATPPSRSRTNSSTLTAEPAAKGSAPPLAQSKPVAAPAVVEPSATGSASPPAQVKTTPASVAAEPRETDSAPLLAQSKPIPAPAAEPSPSGSAIPPVQSKTTTAAVTAESPATGGETPTAQSNVLTKEPVVAATSTAGAAAAPTHATPSSVPTTEQTPLPPASTANRGEIDRPPYGKKLPAVIATNDSLEQMESEKNCPYPAQARAAVETGTAVLLVYVSPDGSAANAQLDTDGTSSSPVLDQAAIKCVREWGRFPPKLVGSKAVGYWARTKFRWSFGGF